jgi:hypothetical protein
VVAHVDDRCIALFQPGGTTCFRREGERGGPQGRSLLPGSFTGRHVPRHFAPPGRVHLWPRGRAWTVNRRWEGDRYAGWYVNLERPWTESLHGIEGGDLTLDVTVADDLASWAWKDEDELAWALEHGTMTVAEADLARRAGEEAIELLEARAWPFVDDDPVWAQCAPDPAWPLPEVPPGALVLDA